MANSRVIRTFSMLGADGAGKTALVEALLRVADAKRANPEGSTSRLDAEPEEKKRNFTLSLHPQSFEEGGRSFHVIDCPGFASFLTEDEWALQVTDGAFLAISVADGAHNRAERTYDVLAESLRPAVAVMTRLDHEQGDFSKALADVEASLKVKAIPLQMPIGIGPGLKGLVDLISQKAHLWDGKTFAKWTEAEVPEEYAEEVERLRTGLVEAAAEADDELLGKYLESGTLSEAEIVQGVAAGAKAQKFLPVACACSKSGVGVRELLESGGGGAAPARAGGSQGRSRRHRGARSGSGRALLRTGVQDHHRPLCRPHRLRAHLLRHAQEGCQHREPPNPQRGAGGALPPDGRGADLRESTRRGRASSWCS